MFAEFISLFQREEFVLALRIIWRFAPVWIPLFLLGIFIQTWLRYVRAKFIAEQGGTLLEIRLPKDVEKSPAAMELVFNGLFEPVVGTHIDVFLKGQIRWWFSLEMVSLGGEVKFYIWTWDKLKDLVKTRIYSQYPTAEIIEAKDYSLDVTYNPNEISLTGAHLALTKPDPYPIKTYIDYGLDKDPEEEYKIDPLTPVLEFLGSLKPGEQAWMQILIQAHRKEDLQDARLFSKPDWKEGAKKEIKKIIEENAYVSVEKDKPASMLNLTETQRDTIKAIERSIGKLAYDTMVRIIYTGKKDVFDSVRFGGMIGALRQFGSGTLNGLKPAWFTGIKYPWQDFRGFRKKERQRGILEAYKRRSFFNAPFRHFGGKPFVLTTEELATIFHFPGAVAATPTLTRVVSKKAEPPSNLPT